MDEKTTHWKWKPNPEPLHNARELPPFTIISIRITLGVLAYTTRSQSSSGALYYRVSNNHIVVLGCKTPEINHPPPLFVCHSHMNASHYM